MGNFNDNLETARETVSQTPMEFDNAVFNMLRQLSANAIIPLAGLVLTILMTVELISLLIAKNNMGDVDMMMFVKWGIKLIAGMIFVAHSFDIVAGIFSIGANAINATSGGAGGIGAEGAMLMDILPWAVGTIGLMIVAYGLGSFVIAGASESSHEQQKSVYGLVGGVGVIVAGVLIGIIGGMVGGGSAPNINEEIQPFGLGLDNMAAVEAALEAMNLMSLLGLMLTMFVIEVVMSVAAVFVYIIIMYRFIEIFMYISLSALPMATFVNSDFSTVGKNYVKAICAYVFQGLLIIIVMYVFGTLIGSTISDALQITDPGDVSALNGSLWLLCGFCVLLCIALFKTGAVAKSIFGVS